MSEINNILPYYPRYGGFGQSQPLSAEDKLYDATHRALDEHEEKLRSLPSSKLTVGELLWISQCMTRMMICPTQEQMNLRLQDYIELLARIDAPASEEKSK